MLSSQHRFHGRTSLNFVYRHGLTVRTGQAALRFIRNPRRKDYRLAVIVSRKVHKSAVQRNRVRRRIYEIVRTGHPISDPYDIIITVFSDQLGDMPANDLQTLLAGLLSKSKVCMAPSLLTMPDQHDIVKVREDEH
jgi:ribonuclease P protein component